MIETVVGGLAILGIGFLIVCAIVAIMWLWDEGILEFLFWLGVAGFILYYGAIEFYHAASSLGTTITSWGGFQ